MADHHNRHNSLGQDALSTTPASLMLDARLTPLERNGWQVLNMLRSAEGISPLANLGQLRRYLTSTPLGQRAGYETARRVLVVLRLTGWISLVGQQRDPLTGHVLSELYQVHESALHFQQACTLDARLPALLQAFIGHENNQVDRVAVHIQAMLTQAPEAASIAAHDQLGDDDDLPPTTPSQANKAAAPLPLPGDSAGSTLVPQQGAVKSVGDEGSQADQRQLVRDDQQMDRRERCDQTEQRGSQQQEGGQARQTPGAGM